ncbi:MAG: DUF3592 domain-containing protein [Anaerolineaceae bacterium]|nr:DUF3592 domain-containing protein [Anaerolineaceae bacterium]
MIFIVAIGCLFIFQGLKGFYHFVNLILQWKQSQAWPSTRGKINQSDLKSVRVPMGGRKGYDINGFPRMRWAYIPDIVYSYRANAGAFESRKIFFGQIFPCTLDYANDLLDQYAEGDEITVYYNPEKPEMAMLDRNRKKEIFSNLYGGLVFIIIGLFFLAGALAEM